MGLLLLLAWPLPPQAPIEAKSDLGAPDFRRQAPASGHRLLNEESRLQRAALAALHSGVDQAGAKPEGLLFGLEFEQAGVGCCRITDRAITVRLLLEIPKVERESDLSGQVHSRRYPNLHVITGVPAHHLFGRDQGGENPVGRRDPFEDPDRLLDPRVETSPWPSLSPQAWNQG